MAKNIITGIDVGDYAVKVVVAEIGSGKYPKLLAAIKKESRGLRRGYILDREEAEGACGEAIEEAERVAGQRIRRAYMSLSGCGLSSQAADGSVIASRADSEITDADVKRALDAAEGKINDLPNRRVLDIIPLSYKLDGKKIVGSPKGMKGSKLEAKFLFVTCLSHHLEELLHIVEKNRVGIEDALPATLAASFVSVSKTQKMAGCLLADIGAGTTTVSVFEEGLLYSCETIDIGSQDITNDIALGLKVSLEQAEAVKLERSSHVVAQKKLDDIIEARLSDIFELINNHLEKLGRSELLPAGVIISGGGAFIPKIETFASTNLNLPAKIASPLYPQHLRLAEREREDPRIFLKDPSFAASYGLIIYGQNPKRDEGILGQSFLGGPFFGIASRWLKNFLP